MSTDNINYKFRAFKIKLFNWEYWPMYIVYFPVSFYYLYLSIKAKSFFFFSASNPSIETGGMFFESKWKIFELLPKEYFPKTIFLTENKTDIEAMLQIKKARLNFPIILKPDRGERGWGVKIIQSEKDLITYRKNVQVDCLIQQYIDYPIELSIFYYRHPESSSGKITSITLKELLSVTGNGKATVKELVIQSDRSFLQLNNLLKNSYLPFEKVLKKDEKLILVPYGNHVRGAMFLDYNHLINNELDKIFNDISLQIKGFYFGRFDLRCTSIEDLKKGKNIAILELNGAGAEPSHIYDPNFSFIESQKVIAKHYKMMYEAAVANKKKGINYMTYSDFKVMKTQEKAYKNKVTPI